MYVMQGRPFKGKMLERLKKFLEKVSLRYDEGVEMTACACDDDTGEVIASASRQGAVLKCIGVSPDHQGEGLAASVCTEVVTDAIQNGITHLFVFTKPSNRAIFDDLGFTPMVATGDVLVMENRRDGVKKFVDAFKEPDVAGTIGAIVANCNPFTKGHQYLMETAASQCDLLHVFVLSAEKSLFPADLRFEMVKAGVAHLPNVRVHPTGDYQISAATFPDYFLKDLTRADDVKCELDLEIFAQCFAKPLNITRRFVGTEPISVVTNHYNETMKVLLPKCGIEVTEIERKQSGDAPISATRVRAILAEGNLDAPELKELLPETTLNILREKWQK